MKNVVIIILTITSLSTKGQGIFFNQGMNWSQIKELAKTEKKYIFVDAYATWCVPCKEMDSLTFRQKIVGEYINPKFVSVKVQIDQTKNDSETTKKWREDAKTIALTSEIRAFPTIVVYDSEGDLLGKVEGYRDANGLIGDMQTIIRTMEEFRMNYQKFLAGRNDSSFVKSLVYQAKSVGLTSVARDLAQRYIDGLIEPELFKFHNLSFIFFNTTRSSERGFKVFREQGKKIDEVLVGFRKPSLELTNRIIKKEEIDPLLVKDKVDWTLIESNLRKKYGGFDTEFYNGVRMSYALDNKLWDDFSKFYALYYKTAFDHSAYHVNNVSWIVFEKVSDQKVLEVAIKATRYNIEHADKGDPYAIDTHANLLYKAGRKPEAINWMKKAVELSKNEQQFVATLWKMERGDKTW